MGLTAMSSLEIRVHIILLIKLIILVLNLTSFSIKLYAKNGSAYGTHYQIYMRAYIGDTTAPAWGGAGVSLNINY